MVKNGQNPKISRKSGLSVDLGVAVSVPNVGLTELTGGLDECRFRGCRFGETDTSEIDTPSGDLEHVASSSVDWVGVDLASVGLAKPTLPNRH